jgi:two-component system chemotaxis sensor kinase CheA
MDDLTKDELDQLMGVFRDQAISILDEMTQDLLTLEADQSDTDALARLRRGAHTIKGDAACIGLEGITDLAHRLEDIFDQVIGGTLSFQPTVVNVFLEGLDEMRAAIVADPVQDVTAVTLSRMADAVESLRSDHRTEETGDDRVALSDADLATPTEGFAYLSPDEIDRVRMSSWAGELVYMITDENGWTGGDLASIAGPDSQLAVISSPEQERNGHVLVATMLSPEGLRAWLKGRQLGSGLSVSRIELLDGSRVRLSPVVLVDGDKSTPTKGPMAARRLADYVRVEAARIDALLNLAGEMVIARSVMNQVVPDLEQAFPKNELVTRFSGASLQLGKLIAELQKGVLKMRMVTIDNVFRRFSRPMRELAADRGKLVELEISGGDTELDRTLVDLIYEPLLHLLRNSVDHGIESPEEREASGKARTGKIRMRAYHEGNQVVVEVSDDGRGVDVAALRARAVESGKLAANEAAILSDDDALELMFLEGLSTARELTRVSGRGVGASTVKSVVEELRGSISVNSEPGAGTTFALRMPLTLAIIKALLFSVGDQLFALPLLAVSEVALASPNGTIYLDGFESFRLRDRFISVVRPGLVMGFQTYADLNTQKNFFVVIVGIGGRRFGIAADTLMGEQELVIKPLDSEWVQNEALAGASVLGDGRVVLILDAASMLRKAIRFERSKGTMPVAV